MQAQNRGGSHNCQGPRCVCQRYENGELAAAMMNQGRNNPEREDQGYQNAPHGARAFQNRASNTPQLHPNLNPNYQNPIDLIRNYNRRPQQQQEPEENIYERLDNEDDEDDVDNAEVPRNEPLAQNNQGNADNHTYERIDNRAHCRYYKYHGLNHAVPVSHSLLNDVDGAARNASQYDQPRHIYIDYSRLSGNSYQNSLSRLGRNCFSTENIAYASTRRSVQPLVYNCTCPYCRHADTRHLCHHCHSLHNRLRQFQDAGNSRQYVYQVARSCRCPFCRGEYPYMKLPANALRAAELFKMECCHCRNPTNCTCRGKIPLDSSSAIYFGRYLDWINRTGQSVNNPLYATIHVGRMDRASIPPGHGNASNGGSQANQSADPGPSTSSVRFNDASSSSILRSSVFAPGASASNASICPVNRYVERQHTCDDSCIRSQSGSLAGICQVLGRCERTECNHGRLSVHWWFVNKLPLWSSHNPERNADGAPCVDEVPREQRESDSDDS